jgi:biotin transport system substrate-specific component
MNTHRTSTLALEALPRGGVLRDLMLVLGFSFLTALTARIAIPLPFTPVPITGQTLGVLLTGALLGSRRAALTMVLYALEGAAGLPVFAFGRSGIAVVLGPTGGYILGFVVAAFVVGLLCERGFDRRPITSITAMVVGNLCIYALGVVWLSAYVGLQSALVQGVAPFLLGDALKILVAALAMPGGWYLLKYARSGLL